jgi:hypothetical protein
MIPTALLALTLATASPAARAADHGGVQLSLSPAGWVLGERRFIGGELEAGLRLTPALRLVGGLTMTTTRVVFLPEGYDEELACVRWNTVAVLRAGMRTSWALEHVSPMVDVQAVMLPNPNMGLAAYGPELGAGLELPISPRAGLRFRVAAGVNAHSEKARELLFGSLVTASGAASLGLYITLGGTE